MKDLSDYNIDDYLTNSSFKEWVRNSGQKPDPDWEKHLNGNPEQQKIALQARHLLLATAVRETDLPEGYINTVIENTISDIRKLKESEPVYALPWLRPLLVAASVALLIICGLWYRSSVPKDLAQQNSSLPSDLIQKVNNSGQVMPVVLPDGSSVLLQPKSQISYPPLFDSGKRVVNLSGQAFFEVTKDPQKPFYVYASGLVTRVLGTSFTVSAYEDRSSFAVIVKTGKVNVSTLPQSGDPKAHSSLDLEPDQQAIFHRKELSLVRSEVNLPATASVPTTETTYVFNDTPVNDIFEKLSRQYGILIKYDDKLLADCALTTTLADEPLFVKLSVICEAIGPETHFSIINNDIVITSKGCNQ